MRHYTSAARYIAIGDIHGCATLLQALLSRLQQRATDTVVFLGDYIDRGPNTPGTLETLLEFSRRHATCVFLRGNHEAMLLDFAGLTHDGTGADYLDPRNGGTATLQQYGCSAAQLAACADYANVAARRAACAVIPPAHLALLAGTRMWHCTPGYLFVHAGVRPHVPLKQQHDFDCLWIRDDFLEQPHDLPQLVVYGHTPVLLPPYAPCDEPDARRLGLDTGAVYGGRLTAAILPAHTFISVRAGTQAN